MKSNKIKIYAFVIFLAIASVIIWITVNRMQREPLLPAESSPKSVTELFFGDTSCLWPCWQGITPGVTKFSDALELLQDSTVVSKSTIQTEGGGRPGFGTARWKWETGNSQFDGDLEWQDGIVGRIGLEGSSKISIGEIVRRFGSPEKVSVIDCSMIVEAPQEWCARFYYAKRGFEIDLKWQVPENKEDIQLSPSDPVRFIYLFQSSTIEDWLLYLGIQPQIVDLRNWNGYGNLLELYVR